MRTCFEKNEAMKGEIYYAIKFSNGTYYNGNKRHSVNQLRRATLFESNEDAQRGIESIVKNQIFPVSIEDMGIVKVLIREG
jgi:flagellar basal body rod protein FlgG